MPNLLLQSMTYIQTNINVMSNEIPEDIIDYWIIDSNVIVDIYSEEWIVFQAIYDTLRSNQGANLYYYSKVELSKLFYVWQQELKKVKASFSDGTEIEPFPILSIDLMNELSKEIDWEVLYNSMHKYTLYENF